MQRRHFVQSSLLVLGATTLARPLRTLAQPANPPVKTVLVLTKCHFDAGFIDTQANVVAKYFTQYFPQAIALGQQLHQGDHPGYIWTTGSWLLYEYLEQANPADRRAMESAIARGHIAWHALPFTWQSEMLDPSMIQGSISIARALDSRFGTHTTGAKMTDVPGHTRGLIAPLAAAGVTFLDIGVNDASTTADLPPFFQWRNRAGQSLNVLYHPGYGTVQQLPGTDLAIAIVVRDDNAGPHTPDEVASLHTNLAKQFPGATIRAANLTTIANAIQPLAAHLPVITDEIGDSWIYGIASDPLKIARYREVARLRQRWIAHGHFKTGDTTDLNLLRRLLLEVEHTWGTDTKTWLDFDHYLPADLAPMLPTPHYQVVRHSWDEKRQALLDGLATLPTPLRTEAEAALHSINSISEPVLTTPAATPATPIETTHFTLTIDPVTGAIIQLRNRKSGREWASPTHPLARFTYQTLSQADYSRFFANYVRSQEDWAFKDFGKPNIEHFGAVSRDWQPALDALQITRDDHAHHILARLHFPGASPQVAAPARAYLALTLPHAEPVIDLALSWFDKPATRMPEALWLSFSPIVDDPSKWLFDKSGERIAPLSVASGGSRHLHAVSTGVSHSANGHTFALEALDAPLIALGEKSPINFSHAQPDLTSGIHANLYNNAWGTNYIMWFSENTRLRYRIRA